MNNNCKIILLNETYWIPDIFSKASLFRKNSGMTEIGNSNFIYMFTKLKEKINTKKRKIKKAAFLAIIAYVYDKISNRKKIKGKEYLEDVEYEVKEKK